MFRNQFLQKKISNKLLELYGPVAIHGNTKLKEAHARGKIVLQATNACGKANAAGNPR